MSEPLRYCDKGTQDMYPLVSVVIACHKEVIVSNGLYVAIINCN